MSEPPPDPRDPYAPGPRPVDPYAPGPVPADPYDLNLDEPEARPVPAPAPRPLTVSAAITATAIRCTGCGYNLTGVAIGSRCPECGTPVDPSLTASTRPPSGFAITAMVLGILSTVGSTVGCMCMGPLVSVPCGAVGLIFWYLARPEIAAGRVSPGSAGMNTAGLITSLVGLGLGLLGAGLFVVMIIAG